MTKGFKAMGYGWLDYGYQIVAENGTGVGCDNGWTRSFHKPVLVIAGRIE